MYRFAKDTDEVFEDKKGKLGTLVIRFGFAVDELIVPVSQEGKTQTRSSTRQISRVMGLTQRSSVQIIYRDLGLSVSFVH